MDVTPYMDLKIAPRAVFDTLEERSSRPRFMLPTQGGDWTAVTWGAFADQIRRAGMWLRSQGVGAEDRVAIFAPNRVEWMSAALGAQAVGGAMVPIYGTSTAEQAGYVIEHSDAKVVFVDTVPLVEKVIEGWELYGAVEKVVLFDPAIDVREILERFHADGRTDLEWLDIEGRFVTWPTVQTAGRALVEEKPGVFEEVMSAVGLDQMAVMLYTSGTTGRPKGVPLTHRNVGVNGRDWLEINGPLVDENGVDVLWLPLSHIFGFGEACLGNTLGFTSYMSDPFTVLEVLPKVRPSIFMSVPRYYEKLAATAAEAPTDAARREKLAALTGGRLKFCLSGGAGLKREVKEFFYDHGILITEGYGLTEASPTITLNRPDAFRFDTVGKPLPSVQVRLADDGEILARGESIFGGYHKDPQASAEVLTEDGWLKTGDLGQWTEDGFLKIVGRKKEILVTAGGKNIAPVNIEQQFLDDPRIAQVVVYGDGEKYLVAGIWTLTAVSEDELETLVERVNSGLARYETIKKFAVMKEPLTVENGFLTPTLKVKRNRVYEAFGDVFRSLY